MSTLQLDACKDLDRALSKALKESISYSEYRAQVNQWAKQNSNSGPIKTEAYANYTRLNDKRMNRWGKTLKVPVEIEEQLKSLQKKVIWLVITESWCGDASPSLPVMQKMAEVTPKIDLRIVYRDEQPDLMDCFLTNGSRSIPKMIVLQTETNKVIAEWGPRSTIATKMVEEFKSLYGLLTPEFKQDLQVFYNKDKGNDIFNDLASLLTLE